ncbi:NADH-quinone oxidoreductase subunit M [Olivibacter domesticus]|uniref:NADH dehydrogenase subunit M n=1 Tax=Olivibacter domesticus TaxID=407022 RepID=A0A1H7MR69_OLID1|nr:NADH-quinone oxidoreductase subunit M [Olivibacter domesticus]SEL13601.1 NADH dehydrogenase subunit M [Olivibacter domesticus]
MILVYLIGLLMGGGVLALLMGQWNNSLPKWIALCTVSTGFILLLSFWIDQSRIMNTLLPETWMMEYRHDWISTFGISFHLAIDGLSLLLLVLTFFLGILAVLCSWKEVKERIGFYHFNLLWILAGISGVFMAMDLFLFYFFWEVMLIPMYFLIGIWGSENREYAAYKFFIFTQASGLLMLLAILGIYFIHGSNTGNYTFNYFELLGSDIAPNVAFWLMLGFMVAFVVKLPIVPFHSWLPDAHSEAPTAGSLILAGLLLKTGAYGILRFVLPLFPGAAQLVAPWAMLLGVIGIIYGAILAYSQTDLKRLIAYTSVSHMGFIMLGIFAFNELALQGVVMQLVTHAISTGALFIMAGMLKERLHTRDLRLMGGLWTQMPQMGASAILLAMASLGLPGLGNFIAEFLILLGAFKANVWLTILATCGLIFSAIYSLRLIQQVFLGASKNLDPIQDFSWREITLMASLLLSIIWLGLYPQPVINTVRPTIKKLEELFLIEKEYGHILINNKRIDSLPEKNVRQVKTELVPSNTHSYVR